MNDIIGFAGKMRSGKGAAAAFLKGEYNYSYVEVADFLKSVCVELTGLSDVKELNEYKNNNNVINIFFDEAMYKRLSEMTGVPFEFIKMKMLGKRILNVRVLLQMLGTDVLRNYNENWHIYHLADEIMALRKENKPVVIGDIRFANEKLFVESLGGVVYYVNRDDNPVCSHHVSENSLSKDDFKDEYVIENSSDVFEFLKGVKQRLVS